MVFIDPTSILMVISAVETGDVYHLYLEKAKQALVPPNPKLFDTDTLTSFC